MGVTRVDFIFCCLCSCRRFSFLLLSFYSISLSCSSLISVCVSMLLIANAMYIESSEHMQSPQIDYSSAVIPFWSILLLLLLLLSQNCWFCCCCCCIFFGCGMSPLSCCLIHWWATETTTTKNHIYRNGRAKESKLWKKRHIFLFFISDFHCHSNMHCIRFDNVFGHSAARWSTSKQTKSK